MDMSGVSGPIDPTWWNTIGAMASDGFRGLDHHASLDAMGLVPGVGELVDGFNGIIYTLEGDATNAGISFVAMVPLIGDAGKAGKYINKGAKHFANEAAQEAAEQAVKHGDDVLQKVGKNFTQSQKKHIYEMNKLKNGGIIKSDMSGEILVPPQKSQKGVTPPSNEAQIDHIYPKSLGGSNTLDNAQVLSRVENRTKSNNAPPPPTVTPNK